MRQKIIVDTSIWIEYFKNNTSIADSIDAGLDKGYVYTVGPVLSELLQGVKSQKEFNMLSKVIHAIPYLDCDSKDWIDAGILSYSLRKKGITLPLTDIIIAAIAKNNHAAIYTLDKHFISIPDIELFK